MTNQDLVLLIRENVILGRFTRDEEGLDETRRGEPGVSELVALARERGVPVKEILEGGFSAGLEVVGRKYEEGEYFLPELILAAECVSEAVKSLEPFFMGENIRRRGRIVMATVEGDHHDIGKNVVAMMLRGAGFEVIDLGVDVPAPRVALAVREDKPRLLGLSALLTSTMQNMGGTLDVLDREGLRAGLSVIIGGAPTSPEFARRIGADAHCLNALEAVQTAKSLVSGRV